MEKKNLDWANVGFRYWDTDFRFVATYKDGKWDEGSLITESNVTLSESSAMLQYAQNCFEGLKAYTTAEGKIVCFRPDLNASRMADSCRRMKMPPVPEELFLKAIREVVRANAAWVPPYGYGASLYIRPFVFGTNPVIGVKSASEFQFRVYTTPVGPYFKDGVKALKLRVADMDRAAPRGTGHVKTALNYAMSIYAVEEAHELGYDENLYLDAATRTYVEETGGANLIFVKKDGNLVIPKSDSILPSITRRSLIQVAKDYLGLEVEERPVALTEIGDFEECGLCGTAAVLSPVGTVDDHGTIYQFAGMGTTLQKMYDTLVGIQLGTVEAPEGWIMVIE